MTTTSKAPGSAPLQDREPATVTRPLSPQGDPSPGKPKRVRPTHGVLALWRSTIGKKAVMAVTGLLMVLFLLLHMIGNLKIFFGPLAFNDYAEWLRTLGTPFLHRTWYLFIQRAVMTVALVLHVVAAIQLTRRDNAARPSRYQHAPPVMGLWKTRQMRYGGTALFLFLIWHLLDLSNGVGNNSFHYGKAYGNVETDFSRWWANLIYIVAMVALGFHINHGFWSASQSLGYNRPSRNKLIRYTGTFLALVISLGFIVVPVAVMAGLVS